MIADPQRREPLLIVPRGLRSLVPDDHILKRVDAVLDLSWLRAAVKDRYYLRNGRPSIPPESALRLMLAGFFLGIIHDRRLFEDEARSRTWPAALQPAKWQSNRPLIWSPHCPRRGHQLAAGPTQAAEGWLAIVSGGDMRTSSPPNVFHQTEMSPIRKPV